MTVIIRLRSMKYVPVMFLISLSTFRFKLAFNIYKIVIVLDESKAFTAIDGS